MTSRPLSHAIVLGGSAAGLMSAAALSRFADRVTLIERDELPDAPVHRKGTPQSRHANNVLARCVSFLESLLPGIGVELVAAGAVPLRDDVTVVLQGVRLARCTGAPTGFSMTRPLLDAVLRRRVRALSNVELCSGVEATDLVLADDRSVRGVVVRHEGDEAFPLRADLVVDAMGRGTRARRWLEARGFSPPPVTELDVGVRYATRLFRRRTGGQPLVLVGPTSELPRGGVAFAVENDRWLVTLFGYASARPPVELASFRDYAASLVAPDVAVIVSAAEPICDGATFNYPTSRLRMFDRVKDIPAGYVCLGDALCNLNPSYGQGLTSAALQVEALAAVLTRGHADLERRYYAAAVAAAKRPFESNWSFDADLPGVHLPSPPVPALARRYTKRVLHAAAHHPSVALALLRVINLVDRPERLLRPAIAWRALWSASAGSNASRGDHVPAHRRSGSGIGPRSGVEDAW